MSKRRALGKGLSALIPEVREPKGGEYFLCSVEQIRPNQFQPRRNFDDQATAELAASIKEKGLLQPLVVRRLEKGYELIAGERRWRAAQLAGLGEVPVVVKEVNDSELLEMALVENIQREDLNPLEEALVYQQHIEELSFTQEDLSRRVGKDRSTIANALRLLKLPREAWDSLVSGELSRGHARAILGLESKQQQKEVLRKVLKAGLSVRETERLVQRLKSKKTRQAEAKVDPQLDYLTEQLKRLLKTMVRIKDRGGKGKVEIEYYSWDDLERILNLIRD
ncbi:MAG: ParB/RepB/Spo0J family partition protein [Deltaproteobacteria bacterium]|nr:MAG: ParB/RepB/Spo0J family partition protein [Deltaproteobacteria bacterium]